jgi:hypothetical protein
LDLPVLPEGTWRHGADGGHVSRGAAMAGLALVLIVAALIVIGCADAALRRKD